MAPEIASVEGVVHVEVLRGSRATAQTSPSLLVEVPHGADRRHHYDALRSRLVGDLPSGLEDFFHVNTDVGAWQLGRRTAALWTARSPQSAALVVRCLIPRTFIDCNRRAEVSTSGDLTRGGITAGLPPYVRHADDVALLLSLHARYVEVARAAYDAVCGSGGLALSPHTYGPKTLDVHEVDDDIVSELHRAHEPAVYAASPWRAEIDLITRDRDGVLYAPEGLAEQVTEALTSRGFTVVEEQMYHLHPATMGHLFSTRWPGRVFSFEVRRDLLVAEWTPFAEQQVDADKVEAVAEPLARALEIWGGDRV